MGALLILLLLLVAVSATAVVLNRRILNQALMVSLLGMALTLLFFGLQAPDVALSEMTVGVVLLPLMILLTLARVRRPDRER
ncbi:MAG: hydrogenase subunit MbhD domain-containing protein [Candidatus Dormibacteria bacterium]